MIELKFYKSVWLALLLIIMPLPFVSFSLYRIIEHIDTGSLTLYWFSLCFFGLGIPLGIFNLFDRRPQIIINDVGVFAKISYKDYTIEWEFIKDAYFKELQVALFSKQKFISLVLDPDAPVLAKSNKTLIKISNSLGFKDFSISVTQLKKSDWEKVAAFIKSLSQSEPFERQKLLLNYEQ
jgi:hypothetical protein